MALPVEYNLVTVYGKYIELDGDPVVGYLTFKPSPTIIKAMVSQAIIVPVTLKADLDGNGEFSIDLPATDDPDINPGDWTYEVTEGFGPRRVYSISVHLADAPSVNIFQKAPIPEANGTFYLQGATGPAGPPVIVTTGQPGPAVGSAGAYAVDWAAGIVYHRTTTTWDAGTHLASVDIATHAAVSSNVHGVVGTIVGTDNVQTLTSKTLASPTVTGTLTGAAANFSGAVNVGGAASVGGDLAVTGDIAVDDITADVVTMNSGTVSANPTVATSLVNKGYVDGLGVSTATAGTAVRRDGSGDTQFNQVTLTAVTPTAAGHAARKDYVDTGVAGAKTYADGITKTSAQISDATASNTASTVVKRGAAGDIAVGALTATQYNTSGHFYITAQIATPADPGVGGLRAWQATDGGLYLKTAAATAIRRLSAHWGSGTTYPTTGVLTADTYFHTGLFSLMRYNGASWRQAEEGECTATQRSAISTALLHHGFTLYETDTKVTWKWDAGATFWCPVGNSAVFGKMWRTSVFSAGLSPSTTYTVDFDAGRVAGGVVFSAAADTLTLPLDGFYEMVIRSYLTGGTVTYATFTGQRTRASVADVPVIYAFENKTVSSLDAYGSRVDTVPLKGGDAVYLRLDVGTTATQYWGTNERDGVMLSARWVAPLNGTTPL